VVGLLRKPLEGLSSVGNQLKKVQEGFVPCWTPRKNRRERGPQTMGWVKGCCPGEGVVRGKGREVPQKGYSIMDRQGWLERQNIRNHVAGCGRAALAGRTMPFKDKQKGTDRILPNPVMR